MIGHWVVVGGSVVSVDSHRERLIAKAKESARGIDGNETMTISSNIGGEECLREIGTWS